MQPATLPMAVDLPQNHRSLNACQKLLGFGQGQTQARDIAKTFRPADLYQIGAQAAVISAGRKLTATPIASAFPQPALDPTDRTSRGVIPPFSGHSQTIH
jgi:hypothetical protein